MAGTGADWGGEREDKDRDRDRDRYIQGQGQGQGRGEGRQRGTMRGGRGEMDGGGWCGQEGEKVRGVGGWPTIAFLA